MAKSKNTIELPRDTVVTVVARSGRWRKVSDMSYSQGLALPRVINGRKWHYQFYQQGYTNLKSNI